MVSLRVVLALCAAASCAAGLLAGQAEEGHNNGLKFHAMCTLFPWDSRLLSCRRWPSLDVGKHDGPWLSLGHAGRVGLHNAARLCPILLDWYCNNQRDVSHSVFPLAIFLPDALCDDSDHDACLVVWKKREAECRVGAESAADYAGNFSHGLTRIDTDDGEKPRAV